MDRPEQVRTRIESVNESLARLRAERLRLLARATLAARKRDRSQKFLIGTAVLAAVLLEGVPALRNSAELLAWLDTRLTRPRDRAAFDLKEHQAR